MYTTKTDKADNTLTGRIIAGHTMYDVVELSELLQISRPSVLAYVRRGKIRGQRVGRKIYVSEEALRDFLGVIAKQ